MSLFCISYPHNTKKSPGERGTHGTLSLEDDRSLFADASAHSVGFMEEERVYIARIVTFRQYRIMKQERFASKFCALIRRGFAAILAV